MMAQNAREIAQSVRSGQMSASEFVRAALERSHALQPSLNALTIIDDRKPLAEAAMIQQRIDAGEDLPLAGVPIVVKDNVWVGGWKITQGSRFFADHIAPRDAIGVERVKKAGAIVIGIGHCPEFACKGLTRSPLYGTTHHPFDTSLTPGGSSGGNSAIVAAGAVPVSIGTDAGGSSRRPPSHCGLVGFKPSQGAIPHPFGFVEPVAWISTLAPIARDVADTALLFNVMAGPDPRDPDSLRLLAVRSESSETLRIAFHPDLGLGAPVDPDVAAAFERALAALASAGLALTQAAPLWPSPQERASLAWIQFAGLAAFYGDFYRRDPEAMDPDVAVQIEQGFALSAAQVMGAVETSQTIRRSLAAFFAGHDLLLSPTTACVAWPHTQLGPPEIGGQKVDARGHAAFTGWFNHGQNPAISIPCGHGRDGLPVGLQIAGAVGEDHRVLAFAHAAEQIFNEAGLWTGLS